jgi:hypothetical protein
MIFGICRSGDDRPQCPTQIHRDNRVELLLAGGIGVHDGYLSVPEVNHANRLWLSSRLL